MERSASFFLAVLLVAATTPALLVGCSRGPSDPRIYHLRGKVTYQGQPLPAGVITFEPDPEHGGSGPQGFAEIVNGSFDTTLSGKGTTGRGQIVVISGHDGVATEDNAAGNPLFHDWKTKVVVPLSQMTEMDFDVVGTKTERKGGR